MESFVRSGQFQEAGCFRLVENNTRCPPSFSFLSGCHPAANISTRILRLTAFTKFSRPSRTATTLLWGGRKLVRNNEVPRTRSHSGRHPPYARCGPASCGRLRICRRHFATEPVNSGRWDRLCVRPANRKQAFALGSETSLQGSSVPRSMTLRFRGMSRADTCMAGLGR